MPPLCKNLKDVDNINMCMYAKWKFGVFDAHKKVTTKNFTSAQFKTKSLRQNCHPNASDIFLYRCINKSGLGSEPGRDISRQLLK